MQSNNSPNPNYDFILKDAPAQKRSLIPTKNPILMIAGALIILMLLIIAYGVVVGGGKVNSTGLIDILGRSQEISRITQAQQPNLKDPPTVALAATTQVSANSQQAQVSKYLASHKVKIDKKKLAVYAANDKSVEAQFATAAQTNNLDGAYVAYLKGALTNYSNSLKSAYSASKSADAKAILQNSYDSTQTLLSTPLLK